MAAQSDTPTYSLAGNLLIASPHAAPRYGRCVVLLLGHSSRGACGMLLDDQLQQSLGRLFNQLNQLNERADLSSSRHVPSLELKARIVSWTPGQLEREHEQGVWMALPATIRNLNGIGRSGDLWVDLVRQVGRSVLSESLGIEAFPRDVLQN